MAGHSKYHNIKHRKGAQDKKRAKQFTKLVRAIITAAKSGKPDPELNPALRSAILEAKAQNLPKDKIEGAIKTATSSGDANNYVHMRYEGYSSGGVAVLVEALTDNKNRTAADVRHAFNKYGGNLGSTGSVSCMFDHVGAIYYYPDNQDPEEVFLEAIEYEPQDIQQNSDFTVIYTEIEDFAQIREKLIEKLGEPDSSGLIWKPKNFEIIDDADKAEKLFKLIEALEDYDDVQHVFTNYQLTSEVEEALSKNY
jgi:YebC/PmpR family DNA-binding regulatory protein